MTHKILDNGIVRELTSEEITLRDNEIAEFQNSEFDRALNNLRIKRNNLLAETDYLALSDNTMSDEMKQYRQDLRDITDGLTTVEEVEAVEFPVKPN
tara:strand:- start:157 stop:447 length:291 start_codon:yes stop_codon:yes gene_type:complete